MQRLNLRGRAVGAVGRRPPRPDRIPARTIAASVRYTSVHAPIKDFDEATGIPPLGELPLWVRTIVTHPDVIAALGPYRRLGTRLVLENMDDRKREGRIADELEAFFDGLLEAGVCLDVAHAWSIDPT